MVVMRLVTKIGEAVEIIVTTRSDVTVDITVCEDTIVDVDVEMISRDWVIVIKVVESDVTV